MIDVNARDDDGNTAAHICARDGWAQGLNMLVRHPDHDCEAVNDEMQSISDISSSVSCSEVIATALVAKEESSDSGSDGCDVAGEQPVPPVSLLNAQSLLSKLGV